MKYYILHSEISQTYTTWEVEANSFNEAVQKLHDAKYNSNMVSDIMFMGDENFNMEDVPIEPNDDCYALSDYVDEDE